MITKYIYNILKVFKNNTNGLTQTEYDSINIPENKNCYIKIHTLINDEYVEINYGYYRKHNVIKYIISEKGINAIVFYEKCSNYPHTCEQEEKHTGTKYVIVEHRSGCFGTGVYHMAYTSNMGFTHSINKAKLYDERKEAEKELEEAIKDSPTKYQNQEDYEFSIEEVNISVNVKLPKTFVCKDCGKIYPIEEYYISTYCPNSWNTGVCKNCIGIRQRKEHETMYGRNKHGVFDYDSID